MITIGCPCQNNERTMPSYLEAIRNLNFPKDEIQLAFLINNSTDDTYYILKTFREEYLGDYYKISIWDISGVNDGYIDNRNAGRNYQYFANIRNLWLKMADPCSEWILSIDSDIIVPSDIIHRLMLHDVDMVSALILNNVTGWNNYNIQRWNGNNYCAITDMDYEFQDGLIEVDITGACSLMKKSAIKNTKYRFHKQGEDHGFCIDLKKKGCRIYCDTTIRPEHLR
jgi:cellulose synthase/poly-beta-1,6-N-acetylglucosamine synthase-like glycosyltransferase